MYQLKITNGISMIDAWKNFDDHYDPIWYNKWDETGSADESWEEYCNKILKGRGILHYSEPSYEEMYIDFYTEEDMLAFKLEWS